MKILVITSDIGLTAGGRVIENILSGLMAQKQNLMIVCTNNTSEYLKRTVMLEVPFMHEFPIKLTKLFNILFHTSFRHFYWKHFVYRKHKKMMAAFNPDIIFSIGSGGTEDVLNLGAKLADYMHIPFAIHMLDPIPGPAGWENYEMYRKSRVHTVKKALKRADLLSMGNPQMLAFQQSCLNFDIMHKSFILPDPVSNKEFNIINPPAKNILTYLGSFYGARKPDNLFIAFSEYLNINPDCELHIYGNTKLNLDNYNVSEIAKQKIKFFGFTNDLKTVFEDSKVLIDVDADIEYDVFISSKLKEYLGINRSIICITGKNSPSRTLLTGLTKTIFVTDHNPENIFHSLQASINQEYNLVDFNERNAVLEYLSVSSVCSELIERFHYTINKRK